MARSARSVFAGAWQVARLLPSVDRPLTGIVAALGLAVAVLPIAVSVCAAVLVAHLVHPSKAWNGGLVALVVAVPLLVAALEAVRQGLAVASGAMGRRVDGVLRERAMQAALRPAGVVHLEAPELQGVFSSARNLSPFVFTPGDAAQQLAPSLGARLLSLLAIVVIAVWSPLLALVVLVLWAVGQVVVIATVLGTVASSAIGTLGPEVLYLRDLVLTPPAAKEVRVFGLGGWAAERFESLARARILAAWAARTGQTARYVVAAACFGAAIGIGMAWIGLQAVHGAVDLTGVLVVAVCLSRALAPPNIIADVPVAYGIFAIPAILRAEEVVQSGPADLGGAVPLRPAPQRQIELQDLTFGYPSGNEAVLEHLELTIPAGQRLAIVGLSGSGKTTLIKLLCRLYDPDAGAVVVDGLDLRQADPISWRENLAALFQDFIRWNLSVADNVSLLGDGPSGPAIDRAIAAGGARDIVDKLPSGLDTVLSTSSTGGVNLSGGQWQRIALARALRAVHAGARLLILDEPTANLDPKGELEFYDAVLNSRELRDRAHPVTTILISHRFPTVRHADRIVVLDAGRIAEDGTHDELVRAGGRYAAMFSAQAASFAQEDS